MRYLILFFLFFWVFTFAKDKSEFPFISLNTTKADIFIKNNPDFDGEGVVVFILDSGVDMGIQGLEKLPDGSVKVIDVQDFSGQGDVYYQEAYEEKDEEGTYLTDGVVKVYGANKIDHLPTDSIFYIGVFSEDQFLNSDVEDANNDGEYDDLFPVLVFKTILDSSEQWVAYIDTDGDTNIDDEKRVRDYWKGFDIVHLRGRDKAYAPDILSIGINILPEVQKISFHFDDNAHGTHCAGIAAGYGIHGRKGFNGVAPGARIISLKIGNNTLSGGATVTGSMKKAFNYAVEYASTHPEFHYVLNMSYGIGSEIEGKSEIDIFLDQYFRDNYKMTLCTSNGNEGPGVSTTGTPAAAHRIISVGALLPEESARNTYGFFTRDNEIFYFSSRGGDSEKPDFIAPGAASSTVPYFENRENMWGTSMASPHAAGGIALLLSALKQSFPDADPDNLLIKRALQNTARYLEGYNWLDFGGGLINIPSAWNKLEEWYKEKKYREVIDYQVIAPSTEFADQKGYTVYFNTVGFIPKEKQEVIIKPILPETWDADQKVRYFQAFKVFTEGNFFTVRQEEKYFKGKNGAKLDLYFDADKMKKPGLYTGLITGVPKDEGKDKENAIFRVPVTVIRPYYFSQENGARLKFKTNDLTAGKIKRFFIHVEDDITALKLNMKNSDAPENRYRVYVFDHEGRNIYTNYSNEKQDHVMLMPQENERGTWELVVYSEYVNRGSIEAELELEAYYISISEMSNPDLSWEAGVSPKGKVTFMNSGPVPVKARLSGEVTGYTRTRKITITGDEYRFAVKGDRFINNIEYDIEIINDDYQKMTDFAVNILDYDGRAVLQEGFSYKRMKINFFPESEQEYQMEFIAGFTHSYQAGWTMKIKETRYYSIPYKLFTFPDTFSGLELYPQKQLTATFDVEEPLPSLPMGFHYNFIFHFLDDKKDARIPVLY